MRIPLYLLPHSAVIEVFKGDTAYGPQYGPPVKVRCRMTKQQKGLSRTNLGTEAVSVPMLGIFPVGTDITAKSKVVYAGREYVVKDATPQAGLTPSHVEALLEGL